MSGFLKTMGMIAGVVALAATGVGAAVGSSTLVLGTSLGTIAQGAAFMSALYGIGANLTAKKPPSQGSATEITIGARQPAFEVQGLSYVGGARVHMVGYGTQNDVPNSYLGVPDVYGVGGPYDALVATYADFTEIEFDGGGQAIGYYSNDTLYSDYQLGATPEPSALTPHFAGMPDWGAGYKLSGKPAILWNARFPKDGKRFGSGFFQTGAEWRGSMAWDPREDSTWPGGSGGQRWATPTDLADFAAAKPTWTWSDNPALRALRYALGVWERDETDTDAPYVKVFGIGLDRDAIIVEDFVTLANVCEDNSWSCNGVIYEAGEQGEKWANLKRLLQSGGAEPSFRGGRLGLRINAPRVALDIITRADLAEGEISFPTMQTWRNRLNTISPKYRSPAHKWEYVATQEPVQVTDLVIEDGEEKTEERQYDLVTNPDQAAQLAGYDLASGREIGPVELPCKPRLRFYGPGDLLTLDLPEPELELTGDFLVLKRTVDPATMIVTLTLASENPDKHAFALSRTGTAPPAISIQSPEDSDGAANSGTSAVSEFAAYGDVNQAGYSFVFPTTDRWAYVRIMGSTDADFGSAIPVDGAPITGTAGALEEGTTDALDPGTWYLWAAVYDADDNQLTISGPLVVQVS